MANQEQEDEVINMTTVQDISRELAFQWALLGDQLGFTRAQIRQFQLKSTDKSVQARHMLESWYETSWDKSNKTKLLQDALEQVGRRDLAEKLRCLHWGHQRLSRRLKLPPAYPFLVTVHRTISNKDGQRTINDLNRIYN